MAKKELNVDETVETTENVETEETETEETPEPEVQGDEVLLLWPYEVGNPGTKKSFFGVECTAGDDGEYSAWVAAEVGERELARAGRKIFEQG